MERDKDHKNLGYKNTLDRLKMYYGSGNMSDICNGDTQVFIESQQEQMDTLEEEARTYSEKVDSQQQEIERLKGEVEILKCCGNCGFMPIGWERATALFDHPTITCKAICKNFSEWKVRQPLPNKPPIN